LLFTFIDYTDEVWNDLYKENPDYNYSFFPPPESTSSGGNINPVTTYQFCYGLDQPEHSE